MCCKYNQIYFSLVTVFPLLVELNVMTPLDFKLASCFPAD